jgi:hypothetical protein
MLTGMTTPRASRPPWERIDPEASVETAEVVTDPVPASVWDAETLTSPDAADVVAQAVRAGVGATVLVAGALADSLRRTLPVPPPSDEPAPPRTDALALLGGAALGATVAAGEVAATAASRLVRAVGPVVSWWIGLFPTDGPGSRMRTGLEELDERWRESRERSAAIAATVARELVPQVADAMLDQLDLTWTVAERVDLDAIVARVDLDAVVDRLDIERVLARIDLDEVVGRVDLDAIVDRIDVDDVASRLDIDAVIARVDVVGIASSVIDELDVPGLIRDSTEAVTTESVRGIRVQSANADRMIQHAVARVLRRRATQLEEPTDDHDAPA